MRFRTPDGVEFELQPPARWLLFDQLDAQKATGLGPAALEQGFIDLFEGITNADDWAARLDRPGALTVLIVALWMSRRLAGERTLTFEAAASVSFGDLQPVQQVGDADHAAAQQTEGERESSDPQ